MQFGGAMFFTDYSMSAMELARALEERGFESVWAPEHSHIPLSRKTPFPGGGDLPKQYYDAMDPFVVLTAASQVTKTIKFGTGVLLVQQRDAIQTAKLVASIDQVSQGRFLFGVGGGWNQDEMENHGTVYASRFKRMRESIEAMKEIWTKSEAAYHGEFVHFDPMIARPNRCRNRTRRSMSGEPSRTARAAQSAMVTVGFQQPAAKSPTSCQNSARWCGKPDAIQAPSKSVCSALAMISIG
jgi:probable F420-dependent oxidoreductase